MLSSVLTILALSAAGTVAAPTGPTDAVAIEALSSEGSFSIPAIKTDNVRNGTASLLKAYAKYNIKPTKEMPAIKEALTGLSKRQDGVVTATPYQGVEYLCPVSIGGQTLNLDFDTGSADL